MFCTEFKIHQVLTYDYVKINVIPIHIFELKEIRYVDPTSDDSLYNGYLCCTFVSYKKTSYRYFRKKKFKSKRDCL